jgi:hypothetical protein
MTKKKKKSLLSLSWLLAIIVLVTTADSVYGQSQLQQLQQQQLPNIATDGGLAVSINGHSFNAGDFIIINGTVANYTSPSVAIIQIIDPEGRQVEYEESQISVKDNKNQFSFIFQAGLVKQFDPNWMQISGEYKVIVTYQPPSLVTPERELVELHFSYINSTNNNTIVNGQEE